MKDDRGQGSHWGRSKRVRCPLGVTKVLVLTLLAIVFLIPIIWTLLCEHGYYYRWFGYYPT